MKQINSRVSELLIALEPSQELDENKNFKTLCDVTSVSIGYSSTKTDVKMFCNKGDTTSIITGRSLSISVSLDYDTENEVHKYLRGLIFNQDIGACNNQYVKMRTFLNEEPNKAFTLEGKCCFSFKSMPPGGAADELAKIEFDIAPQDKAFEFKEETIE